MVDAVRVQLAETDLDELEARIDGVRRELRRMTVALWSFTAGVAGSAVAVSLSLALTHL